MYIYRGSGRRRRYDAAINFAANNVSSFSEFGVVS
jgi:hypothetical protein